MGKRKRHTSVTSSTTADDTRWEENAAKRVKIEPVDVDEDPGAEVDVWLIRKPAKLSAAWLSKLKFPRAGKKKTSKVDLSEVEGPSLVCDFAPAQVQMLHVPVGKVRTHKEAMNMKSLGEICGVAFVSKQDEGSSQAIADANEEDAPLEVHSIRRKPVLPVENSKERLKAFGVVPKKKSRRLPNLA